ncbi:MAG: hypothetical protein WB615_01560 [Candidatus Tumulicola sp.]
MDTDPLANAVETFSAPIEGLIIALGQGISAAQQALDKNSIASQEAIDADPVLSQYGLQATWYQFPQVTLNLKMALSIAQDQDPETSSSSSAPSGGSGIIRPIRLVAQPLSASYQTHFNYDATAASEFNIAIAPVPPPKAGSQAVTPPTLTPAQVQTIALASAAGFVTTTVSGTTVPAATDSHNNALKFTVNYNAAAATWYALQYAPSNSAVTPIVVAVDDATKSVRIVSST